MELFFLAMLVLMMASALGSGYPVAFALPGSAIITIGVAALCGYLFAGDSSAFFAHGSPVQWLTAGVTNFRGVYWEVERDTLIAIPLFVFMGIMLQRSKIAEDLLVAMAQLFGPVPGGLGISVVFVGALLAATTGIVGATVVAMGLISLPAMLRNNYSHSLATGTIAASGTLGQIIPPSIVLIILADQLASAVDQADASRKALYKATTGQFGMPSEFGVISTSAGDMFLGAFIPGLVLVGLYMAFILVFSFLKPKHAPAVAFDGAYDRAFAGKILLILVPPLTLIFVVLGSIIMGIATVNQAGAIGAAGAMVMAGYRLAEGRKDAFYPAILAVVSLIAVFIISSIFNVNIKNVKTSSDMLGIVLSVIAVTGFIVALVWSGWRTFKIEDTMRGVMVDTAKTTSLVFIILLGAAMLTAAFRAFGGEELVREFLTSLPGGFWAQFIIVMLVIFVLGFFLDFIEIAVVVVPIVAPILLMDPGANVTAVWLGVMIGLNIQTSFLTPPFGFALFYLRGVAPAIVKTTSMYKGVIAFISLQLLALVIVGLAPGLVNYLPNRISLTANTAPPPINPRLQHCMEQYIFNEYAVRGDELRGAIATAGKLDVSYLPKKLKSATEKGFKQAASVYGHLETIGKAEAARDKGAEGFRDLHFQVRRIQGDMRKLVVEKKAQGDTLGRLKRRTPVDQAAVGKGEAHLAEIDKKLEALKASIPANWDADKKAFETLQKADTKARNNYRNSVDTAYKSVADLITVIEATPKLEAFKGELNGLTSKLGSQQPKEASATINELSKRMRKIAGVKKLRSDLSSARRALRGKSPNLEKAQAGLEKALATFADDLKWRKKAQTELLPGLKTYEATIRDTIGLRQQRRLPEAQALSIAQCSSNHRDISLHF
ncbi:MAG: TRAP transporter large permease subunit [Alphaproteobacteria bacterium]|nr:TRAP transporter large permease subunit [Alphaproteobacteria bacterium]